MPLPEDLRQEYLQALGIDSYFPRRRLPAAPEPVLFEWPDRVVQAAPDSVAASEQAADTTALDNAADGHREPGIATVQKDAGQEDVRESIETPSPESLARQQETFRLQMLCIRVNDDLAVLNAMPHLGPKQLSGQHRQLLQNVLRHCGIPAGTQLEEKTFHWPMVQGGHIDNSRAAAARALTAYLQQISSDWQFATLLVMGEQTLSRVYSMEETAEAEDNGLESLSCRLCFCRSLDEYLQRPVLKKELWAATRPLRAG